MVLCNHKSCEYDKRVWLPLHNNRGSDLALHPWCEECGLVKNISDDRPRGIGYWMNVLSRIVNRFSITQCQKRLVVKRLDAYECFDDMYGITGSTQKEIFVKIVKNYCSLHEKSIDPFIY